MRSYPTGEKHPRAKLTADDVREIKQAIARRQELRQELREITNDALGEKYGVSNTTIQYVSSGRNWWCSE